MWDYPTALEWLYGRQALGIKLGLEKVRDLLGRMGDPQSAFESVHVAGTNGKGSASHLLAAALTEAGHRTGLFTSPHLVRFTERIQVEGSSIPEAAVADGLWRLRDVVADLDGDGRPPTFFEVVTALAMMHFRDQGVEWAVVETGMGGRLDATNVLSPRLTIITNVTMDHEEHLGTSLQAIATEKAGIMKRGVPCITGADGVALDIIKATSRDLQVPMSILDEDYQVVAGRGLRLVHPGGEARYRLAVAGRHQNRNAALVVAACDALRSAGLVLPVQAVQTALATTTVPGRLESLVWSHGRRTIEVLIDGAHNEAGAHALRAHLATMDLEDMHLVAGFSRDKPWRRMLDQWAPLAVQVWGVPLRSGRGLDPATIGGALGIATPFAACADVAEALGRAAAGGAHLIVVAGSLFLAGEARAVVTGESMEEIRGTQ